MYMYSNSGHGSSKVQNIGGIFASSWTLLQTYETAVRKADFKKMELFKSWFCQVAINQGGFTFQFVTYFEHLELWVKRTHNVYYMLFQRIKIKWSVNKTYVRTRQMSESTLAHLTWTSEWKLQQK